MWKRMQGYGKSIVHGSFLPWSATIKDNDDLSALEGIPKVTVCVLQERDKFSDSPNILRLVFKEGRIPFCYENTGSSCSICNLCNKVWIQKEH